MNRWSVVAIGGLILGILAETTWPPGVDRWIVVGDAIAGFALIGAAIVVRRGAAAGRLPDLLLASGLAWFAGTWLPSLVFLQRGLLLHVAVSDPAGRLRTAPQRAIVAVGYLVVLAEPIARLDAAAIGFGTAVIAGGLIAARRRRAFAAAFCALGLVVVTTAVGRLAGVRVYPVATLLYDAAIVAVGVACAAEAIWRTSAALVTRVVVDLGGAGDSGTVQDRLAHTVGDPSLTLGYAVPGSAERFVDEAGQPVVRPVRSTERSVAPIVVQDQIVGVIAFDPAIVGDPRTVELIASAAGLAMSNATTQAAIRARVADLSASRQRLVEAGDIERQRLEAALDRGPMKRLSLVEELVDRTAAVRPEDSRLQAIQQHLMAVRIELVAFARGLYPPALARRGLVEAMGDLARRSPTPVELVTSDAVPTDGSVIDATLYFVCAESLANVEKHARASRAVIRLRSAPRPGSRRPVVEVSIDDDGVGGAALTGGTGLRGLADRVDALGGTLMIGRSELGGTQIRATLPTAVTT